MSHSTRSLLAVGLGVFLFNFLFWGEKMGVNCLLFAVFHLVALAVLFPEGRTSRPFLLAAAGVALTAGMVFLHNSMAAKLAFAVSASAAAGFAQSSGLRFVLHGFLQYFTNLPWVLGRFIGSLRGNLPQKIGPEGRSGWRGWLGLSVVPGLVAVLFYGIYYLANEKFARLSDGFWRQLGELFSLDVSLAHVLFVVGAFLMVGAAFWPVVHPFLERRKLASDFMAEPPGLSERETLLVGPLRQSLLMLGLLNALLLLVNCTDVIYVWFGFEEMSAVALKQYVHEGTYLLIASILLAMGVLFWVFRGDLNFWPKAPLLRRLALAWLVQNAVLAASVGVRNWRYIDSYALAYKRIGVFLFLILVAAGLASLWMKIRDRRSVAWLFRINGWAFYLLMVANALVPWDSFITRYNIGQAGRSGIDAQFLIWDVSDKNLRILEEKLPLLIEKQRQPGKPEQVVRADVQYKRARFEAEQAGLSWKSWNLADAANR